MNALFDRILTLNLIATTLVFYVAARIYLLPNLARWSPRVVLVPILLLHSLRHLGLMFLTTWMQRQWESERDSVTHRKPRLTGLSNDSLASRPVRRVQGLRNHKLDWSVIFPKASSGYQTSFSNSIPSARGLLRSRSRLPNIYCLMVSRFFRASQTVATGALIVIDTVATSFLFMGLFIS
jgi:hypothetical protein